MDALREQYNRPWVLALAGFLIGVFIGLVVLGWWLWPVKWTNAGPKDLRPEYQETYLRMAIDSYTLNPDPVVALQRLNDLGPDAGKILSGIKANPDGQNQDSIQAFEVFLQTGAAGEVPPVQVTPGAETPPAGATSAVQGTPVPAARPGGFARTLLPIMCVITFLLAGGLVAAFFLRSRISGGLPAPRRETQRRAEFQDYEVGEQEPALAQFMTTYQLGNDMFDDSFSVDSQTGEFLGECGVGISESIGVGEPKRVTAFEVWLFDKNDIQTVTQVLMSEHAFSDETIRHRLAAKGEPVVAEPGREMILETATLRLLARVVDMSYGATGALPAESFFDRLTLELVIWSKE